MIKLSQWNQMFYFMEFEETFKIDSEKKLI